MARTSRLRAVIFDLDGTLTDSTLEVCECFNGALVAHDFPPELPERVKPLIGRPLVLMFAELTGAAPDVVEALVATYRAHYREEVMPRTRLFPAAAAALDACERRRLRLAVATGKSIAMARGALAACGQLTRFGAVVGYDEVARPKPHPDTARRALELLGAHPAEALVVGDSVLDVEMGRAAGCLTCAVPSGSFDAPALAASHPDFLIPDLFALDEAVLSRLT